MIEVKNKKAYFDYTILEELEAGIALTGTEIKSIRKGSIDLKDTFVNIKNNEAYILNMYIAKYEEGNIFNHDERRTRKLLLHKKEIKKLKEGDEIFYHYEEKQKKYKVKKNIIIQDTDLSYIENTQENKITLITCVENKPNLRLCIQAEAIL